MRVRAGDNRQTLVLSIEKLTDEITVGRDKQEAAADARVTFGSALTREQIDALSDDPERDARGSCRTWPVPAPSSASTASRAASCRRSRRSSRSTSRATPSRRRTTTPARSSSTSSRSRASARCAAAGDFSLRDGSLSGRSPFTPTKGPERTQNYGFNFGGSIVPQKSSFSVSVEGMTSYDTPNLNAALPSGVRVGGADAADAARRTNLSGPVRRRHHARSDAARRLLPEPQHRRQSGRRRVRLARTRLFAPSDSSTTFRIQEAGPLGRRFFINTRLNVNGCTANSTPRSRRRPSASNDAFTSGGAQTAGGRDSTASISPPISTTSAGSIRCGPASCSKAAGSRRRLRRTIWAPTRSRAWRRSRRGSRGATRGASATPRSSTATCRAASTCRTTSASDAA